MPFDVIVSFQVGYDSEVSQGAMALYYKLARKGHAVVWIELTIGGSAAEPTFRDQLVMSTVGAGGAAAMEMVAKHAASGSGAASAAAAGNGAAAAGAGAGASTSGAASAATAAGASASGAAQAQDDFMRDTLHGIRALVGEFRNASIYVIGHGGGHQPAGLSAEVLCRELTRLFARVLGIPAQTRFGQVVLLACNVGKVPPGTSHVLAPVYPGNLIASFARSPYAVDRVIAWNSWVTLYNFRQLANLCRRQAPPFIEELTRRVAAQLGRMAPSLLPGMGAVMRAEITGQFGDAAALNQPLHASLAQLLEQSMPQELDMLCGLVGQRLIESQRLYARPKQAAQLVKMKMFEHPARIPFVAMPAINGAWDPLRFPWIVRGLRKLLPEVLVRLILEYEGMWMYQPDSRRVIALNPQTAGLLGLEAPHRAAPTSAAGGGAAAAAAASQPARPP